jgi:hypothetical protein
MEKESSKDKFLRECGLLTKPGQEPGGGLPPEAMPNQAEVAPTSAPQAQDETDKNYRRLNAYIRDELPGHLVKTYQEVVKVQVVATMRPLEESVHNAASRIDSCSKEFKIQGEGRLFSLAILVGMFTVLAGGFMVRCTFLGDEIKEAKRYEMWGRQVTARIKHSSPQERERILLWVDGGSLDPAGVKVRREKTGK